MSLPNKKQRDFITKKLIPFIMREQGRGFGMQWWQQRDIPGTVRFVDGIHREVPVCGTVACLGGSIEVLQGEIKRNSSAPRGSAKRLGSIISLTKDEAAGLFFNWETWDDESYKCRWPKEFIDRYHECVTPK